MTAAPTCQDVDIRERGVSEWLFCNLSVSEWLFCEGLYSMASIDSLEALHDGNDNTRTSSGHSSAQQLS